MIKTTTIKDYTTAQFPPVFITDGNSGSFESQGKELADDLRNEGRDVTSLFFDKNEYGEVGHEYQFSIGDGGAGSLCYQQTIYFWTGFSLTTAITRVDNSRKNPY